MERLGLVLMIIGGIVFTILPVFKFKVIAALAIFIGYNIFMMSSKRLIVAGGKNARTMRNARLHGKGNR